MAAEIIKEITKQLPDGKVSDAVFEGANIVLYTKDKDFFFNNNGIIKDVVDIFKKRIELRQIGARDEAKIVKGFGICGRDFCCNTIKNELKPVTIKMAKDQNLTLNSSKISGACGRLLCCLAYEHEAYCEVKKRLPQEGSVIVYDGKKVMLTEINILRKVVTLRTADNIYIQIPLAELPNSKSEMQEELAGKKK